MYESMRDAHINHFTGDCVCQIQSVRIYSASRGVRRTDTQMRRSDFPRYIADSAQKDYFDDYITYIITSLMSRNLVEKYTIVYGP